MSLKDQVLELMERLGISGHQLRSAKLGPGVVGRNSSIAWALEIVMLAGVICGGVLRQPILVGIALIGAVVIALWISYLNVKFGKENPAAALLEGAHFLEFHQMQMTSSRGAQAIELPAVPARPQLPNDSTPSLPAQSTEPEP
jgi:hypothetical protein